MLIKKKNINNKLIDYVEKGVAVDQNDITADNILDYLCNENTFKNKGNWFTRIFSVKRRRFNAFYKALKSAAISKGYTKREFKSLKKETNCFKQIDNNFKKIIQDIFNDTNINTVVAYNNGINNNAPQNTLYQTQQKMAEALNQVSCNVGCC